METRAVGKADSGSCNVGGVAFAAADVLLGVASLMRSTFCPLSVLSFSLTSFSAFS